MIDVRDLTMTYRVPVREPGLAAAFRALWRRTHRDVPAVRSISFGLQAGEVVGFIGPNGAGKTTTLKVLAGVLHPTSGLVSVLGFTPWRRERAFLRQIAMIRGSRPLGVPLELTVMDALRFQQIVYEVSETEFRRGLGELTELLELSSLLGRQVRALSLGERMRAGLAWALVYRPRVLFLDEPTIGLDVSAVATMRGFVSGYAQHTGATILLTSHYMADVERLCRRVVLIDHGAIAYDGALGGVGRADRAVQAAPRPRGAARDARLDPLRRGHRDVRRTGDASCAAGARPFRDRASAGRGRRRRPWRGGPAARGGRA